MKTIMVATDLTSGFAGAYEKTITLARALSGTVYLLHVVLPNEDSSFKDKKEFGQEFADESAALNNLARQFRDQDVETHALLLEGVIAVAILAEAERLQADLIVLGGSGKESATGLLVDNITQKVTKQTQRPVLLFPASD